jgi:hypothetical protein
MKELLTALRENRRGKGLYVEPTDRQVMQIWGQVDSFQSAIAPWSASSLAFAPTKSIESIIRAKTQHPARMFSGAKAT